MTFVLTLIAVVFLVVLASCSTTASPVQTVPASPTTSLSSPIPSFISTQLPPTGNPTPWPSASPGFSTAALPALPADDKEAIDQAIVVVWGSDGNYATGVVIGDGSQVLTTWNFEASNASGFKILVPGGATYEASIQAFDSRNALILLKAEGMKLSAASIGDIQTLKTGQEVIAREWNLPNGFSKVQLLAATYTNTFPLLFSMYYPMETPRTNQLKNINEGATITDLQGNVLGIVGVDYMTLEAHPHTSPFIPLVASIIPGAGVLASNALQQPWINGPLQFIMADRFGGTTTSNSQNYDAAALALRDIENKLADPLTSDELKEYSLQGTSNADGITLTTAYAWPVELHSTNGTLLAEAKWVGIQWNRINGKPDRLFYGGKIRTTDGGFQIAGDISALAQAVAPLIPNGTAIAPTLR